MNKIETVLLPPEKDAAAKAIQNLLNEGYGIISVAPDMSSVTVQKNVVEMEDKRHPVTGNPYLLD